MKISRSRDFFGAALILMAEIVVDEKDGDLSALFAARAFNSRMFVTTLRCAEADGIAEASGYGCRTRSRKDMPRPDSTGTIGKFPNLRRSSAASAFADFGTRFELFGGRWCPKDDGIVLERSLSSLPAASTGA